MDCTPACEFYMYPLNIAKVQMTILVNQFIMRHYGIPNEMSQPYELDESISNLKGLCGSKFKCNSNFKSSFCKQTVETLVLRRLVRVCTVCLCTTKKTLDLNGLNINKFDFF